MKAGRILPLLSALAFLFYFACNDNGGGGGGGGTPTPTPTATPTATPTPEPVIGGDTGLDNPGDVRSIVFDESGESRFSILNDDSDSSRDNRDEEYTLILYNSTGADLGFYISSPDDPEPPSGTSSGKIYAKKRTIDPYTSVDKKFMQLVKSGHPKATPDPNPFDGLVNFSAGDEEGAQRTFWVRCNIDDDTEFCQSSCTLRAQRTNVNVWLDDDVPFEDPSITWDTTQNDIDKIANMFQDNIYPLMTHLFGSESDVNGDDRISIIITPHINRLPWSDNGDVTDFPRWVGGYVDPRDLLAFDGDSNPGSNEGEVIYVYAKDENGFWGPPTSGSYDEDIGALMAAGFEKLISYNQHVFVNEGDVEEDWLSDGLGAVAAMLCGFGETMFSMVHRFLDYPNGFSLKSSSEFLLSSSDSIKYMFMLFTLYSQMNDTIEDTDGDNYDDDLAFISSLYGSLTGEDNLEAAVEFDYDEDNETEFDALFKKWTIALVTSHNSLEQSSGDFPYYKQPNALVFGSAINDSSGSTRSDGSVAQTEPPPVPATSRLSTQVGISLYGRNNVYLMENADELTYTPGHVAYGKVKPYGAMFVRVGGLIEPKTNLLIKAAYGMQGYIVRRTDISYRRIWGEKIFGSLDPRYEDLDNIFTFTDTYSLTDTLPGDEITIVGKIDEPDKILVYNYDHTEKTYKDVYDFDRYHFTVPADTGDIAIWVEKQADSTDGTSNLKPLLAIVSVDNLINPLVTDRPKQHWVYDDGSDDAPVAPTGGVVSCAAGTDAQDPADFTNDIDTSSSYPTSILDKVYYLEVMMPTPAYPIYNPEDRDWYEPRHLNSLTQDCDSDDTNETPDSIISYEETKQPASLVQQIMTYMIREYTATQSDDTCLAVDSEVRDEDTDKETENYQLIDVHHNVGGFSVPTYSGNENGVLYPNVTDLPHAHDLTIECGPAGSTSTEYLRLAPGNEYVILVAGADNTTGNYALKIRRLDDIGNAVLVQRRSCSDD